MIDLRLLRENPDAARASQTARGADPSVVDTPAAALDGTGRGQRGAGPLVAQVQPLQRIRSQLPRPADQRPAGPGDAVPQRRALDGRRHRGHTGGVGERVPELLDQAGPLPAAERGGVVLGAVDGEPVFALFLLVCPTVRLHLQMLAKLASLLRNPLFRETLQARAPADRVIDAARRIEREER